MDLHRAFRRFALLATLLAFVAVLTGPIAATAQVELPACSNGIDDDSDNSIDGDDAGCGDGADDDETDSPYAGIEIVTIALPLVSLQGEVDRKGNVKVSKLLIRARRGSVVDVTCKGRKCPFITQQRQMLRNSLRLGFLERKLKAPLTLTLKIQRRANLGKFVRYKLRRNASPLRTDACLDQEFGTRTTCYPD